MSEQRERRLDIGRVAWPVLACVLIGLAIYVAGTATTTGDYGNPVCDGYRCDNAEPALEAASRGHIADALDHQPGMGPVSLIVRAPVVALARAADASDLDRYRAGAAVCAALALLILLWLTREALSLGVGRPAAAGLLVVATVATLWTEAITLGHPEEPLGGALLLAAAVLAATDRPLAAGFATGAALATKEWALLGVAPIVLMAGLGSWRRVLLPAAAVAIVLIVPTFAANPAAFKHAHVQLRVQAIDAYGSPLSVWWRLGDRKVLSRSKGEETYAVRPPKLVARLVRPATFALSLVLCALWWRRRRGSPPFEALALLALILLLRDVLDTVTFSYHHIPFLMTLAAWEVFARRRLPVVAAAATVCLQVTFRSIDDFYAMNTVYLAWTLPLAVYLAVVCFRRVSAAAPA